MNSIFETVANIIRWPLDRLFSENGYLGSLWHESDRSRSLLLGLPAVLFALSGVLLLAFAQFGLANKLEGQYRSRLEESTERRKELNAELKRIMNMKLASQSSQEATTVDDLIPPDDPLRVDLAKVRKEERVYLEKLNSINPEDSEYLFQLAKVTMDNRMRSAESNAGIAMMRKIAPVFEPGYLPAHLFLADWHALMVREDSVNARKHYLNMKEHLKLVLLREPKHELALKRLAVIYFDERAYGAAYELFYRLFEIDPRQFKMVTEINRRLNRPQDNIAVLRVAAAHLERTLRGMSQDDDDRPRLLLEIAECYRMQRRREDAETLLQNEIKAYSKSKSDASRLLWAKRLLASTYVAWSISFEGEERESIQKRLDKLKEAFKFDSKNAECLRMLTRLGFSQFEEIAKEARSIYNPYEHLDAPGLVINEMGIFALSQSKHDEALVYFKKAAELSPKNPEILNNLAYTLLKCSRPDPKAALATINRAIKLTPLSKAKRYRSNFLDTRARAYMQVGEYTQAIADLTRAWKDRPDNIKILEAIVYCHEKDELLESIKVWQERLELARDKARKEALKKQAAQEKESQATDNQPDSDPGN